MFNSDIGSPIDPNVVGLRISEDPLKVLRDQFIELAQPINIVGELIQRVVDKVEQLKGCFIAFGRWV